MRNNNHLQPEEEKSFFADFLEKFFKYAKFSRFPVLAYGFTDFTVYLIDSGSRILTLIESNIE